MSPLEPSEIRTSVSLRSVSLVTGFSVGQMAVLFLLQVLLAKIFGASKDMDVYLAVFAIPLLISSVLSGSLGSVIIPLSHELKESSGHAAAEAFLNRLGWYLLSGGLFLAIVTFFAAGRVMRWLYSDFSDPQIRLGIELLRILAWLIPLNTLTAYLFSVFHAGGRFLQPAASGLIGPITTVALIVLIPRPGIHMLAWAVLIGGAVGVALLLPGFPRRKTKTDVSLRQVFQRFGFLLAPLVLGSAFLGLNSVVDRHLAAALSEGSISHLGYAWRLITAISLMATAGLSVVAFPAMARHSASGETDKFVSELAHAWRFLCVVLVPMIAGLLCFRETLTAWLLERGEFTPADTQAVAWLMCLYSGVILAAAFGEIAGRAFYSLGKTWTPTLIGIFGFTLGSLAKFALVSRYRAEGLAGVTSVYYIFNNVILLLILRSRFRESLFEQLGGAFLRTLFCTASALAAGSFLLRSGTGLEVPAGIAVSVVCYVGLQSLLGDEFAVRIWRGVRRTLPSRKQRGGTSHGEGDK